jgi:hypothetical protein
MERVFPSTLRTVALPVRYTQRYVTSTLGPGRLAFLIGKKPQFPYGEITVKR